MAYWILNVQLHREKVNPAHLFVHKLKFAELDLAPKDRLRASVC